LGNQLRLAAQFYKLKGGREIWRRLALDIVIFLMAVFIAGGILVIAGYLPISFNESLAGIITSLVYLFLAAVAYGLTGILAAYSAYPTMSVIKINTNSWLRQSLSKPLSAPEIDAVFENL
jgi:hypothetical protein